jgi:hypothetical protein
MTNRITIKHLDSKVETLNDLFGYEPEPYGPKGEDGRHTVNVGTFVLDINGQGSRLCQMVGPQGGQRDLTLRGTARQTYEAIDAFITGARHMKNLISGEN